MQVGNSLQAEDKALELLDANEKASKGCVIVFPTCYNLESLGKSLTEVLSRTGSTRGNVWGGVDYVN